MRISDWSSDVCSSDLLIRRGRPAFLRASAARYPCGDDGGAPSLARYGISHPPRFIWRESSLVTVSIFGSAIKRYLQALLSGSARALGERARTLYAGRGVAVASRRMNGRHDQRTRRRRREWPISTCSIHVIMGGCARQKRSEEQTS